MKANIPIITTTLCCHSKIISTPVTASNLLVFTTTLHCTAILTSCAPKFLLVITTPCLVSGSPTSSLMMGSESSSDSLMIPWRRGISTM